VQRTRVLQRAPWRAPLAGSTSYLNSAAPNVVLSRAATKLGGVARATSFRCLLLLLLLLLWLLLLWLLLLLLAAAAAAAAAGCCWLLAAGCWLRLLAAGSDLG
jgi:hypothetical protein